MMQRQQRRYFQLSGMTGEQFTFLWCIDISRQQDGMLAVRDLGSATHCIRFVFFLEPRLRVVALSGIQHFKPRLPPIAMSVPHGSVDDRRRPPQSDV